MAPLCEVISEAILAVSLVSTPWQMEGSDLYTPQLLFGEVGSSTNTLTHEPFLERARLQREQEREGSARMSSRGWSTSCSRWRTMPSSSKASVGSLKRCGGTSTSCPEMFRRRLTSPGWFQLSPRMARLCLGSG